jgi:hypothetical protein
MKCDARTASALSPRAEKPKLYVQLDTVSGRSTQQLQPPRPTWYRTRWWDCAHAGYDTAVNARVLGLSGLQQLPDGADAFVPEPRTTHVLKVRRADGGDGQCIEC